MAKDKTFTAVITLSDFPNKDVSWYQRELFDAAIAGVKESIAHATLNTEHGDAVRSSLLQVYKTQIKVLANCKNALVAAYDQNAATTSLSLTFGYSGNMEASEDGRCLWMRQAFEDMLYNPLFRTLMERCYIRPPEPLAAPEEVRLLLVQLKKSMNQAMSGANALQSPGFYIVGEGSPAVDSTMNIN